MERKRLVLILMALCLSLAFSVSSVEAEDVCTDISEDPPLTYNWPPIEEPGRCDRDGDCYLKRNRKCERLNPNPVGLLTAPEIDCDDSFYDFTNLCGGDGGDDGGLEGFYDITTIRLSHDPPLTVDKFAVESDIDDPWEESNGRETIGFSSFADIGGWVDLNFFEEYFNNLQPTKYRGSRCFGSRTGRLHNQSGISKHKGGSVLGSIWFKGCTDAGIDGFGNCTREVLYSLNLFGPDIPSNWRPTIEAPASVIIRNWKLIVEAEGDVVKAASCLQEDDFAVPVEILVTRRPEQ